MCIAAGFFANAARLHYTGEYKWGTMFYPILLVVCVKFHQILHLFRSIRGDFSLMIHPSSVLFKEAPPQWWAVKFFCRISHDVMWSRVVYNEVVQTSTMYMRDITAVSFDWLFLINTLCQPLPQIKPDWLHQLAPHFYDFGTVSVVL